MDQLENKYEDDVVEIDLKQLLLKLKQYWYVLVVSLLVGLILGFVFGLLKTPLYRSSSTIYLRNSSATVSLQDLQIGSELTKDYEVLFKSRPILENTISQLSLDMTSEELSSMITISNPSDTRMLTVSIVSDDANLSRDIANTLVANGMNSIREIDSQEPYLVEDAIVNDENVGTSKTKTALIGGLLGLFLSVGVLVVTFILNDHIQSVEDIENTLNLPVLAVILDGDQPSNSSSKKSIQSKNKGRGK